MGIRIARNAVNSGLYPLYEIENGKITHVKKIKDKDYVDVEEYLKHQKRFHHLFTKPGGDEVIEQIREHANNNIEELELRS